MTIPEIWPDPTPYNALTFKVDVDGMEMVYFGLYLAINHSRPPMIH